MNFDPKQKNKHEIKKVCLCLWDRMLKTYYHICNQRPPICLIAKFREKPLSYLQSVPSNLPYFKV